MNGMKDLKSKMAQDHCLEELSAAIDALNQGKYPEIGSLDVQELMETAALVKNACCSETTCLNEFTTVIVDKVLHDRKIRQKQKRLRQRVLIGAIGSVAAAALIFASPLLQVFYGEQEIAQQAGNAPELAARSIMDEGGKIGKSDEKLADSAGVEVVGQESNQTPPAGSVTAELRQRSDKQVTGVTNEKALPENKEKPVVPTDTTAPVQPADIQTGGEKAVTILTLPGKRADSVTVEKQTGWIRQVFGRGTSNEIVVTQKPKRQATTAAIALSEKTATGKSSGNVSEKESALSAARGVKPNGINTVTVMKGDMEITVEGRQSENELVEIAESLATGK